MHRDLPHCFELEPVELWREDLIHLGIVPLKSAFFGLDRVASSIKLSLSERGHRCVC